MPPPESTSPVLGFARGDSLLTTNQLSGVLPARARKHCRFRAWSRRAIERLAGFRGISAVYAAAAARVLSASARSCDTAQSSHMTAQLVLQAGGATDVGKRRTHNEDTVLVRDDLHLYLVADGA